MSLVTLWVMVSALTVQGNVFPTQQTCEEWRHNDVRTTCVSIQVERNYVPQVDKQYLIQTGAMLSDNQQWQKDHPVRDVPTQQFDPTHYDPDFIRKGIGVEADPDNYRAIR